jgi:hypothetical protein
MDVCVIPYSSLENNEMCRFSEPMCEGEAEYHNHNYQYNNNNNNHHHY